MSNKDNKMQRFLASIGITDFERFDLAFEVVNRNPFKREQIDMVIVKDEPWNYELLSEFLEAINRIDYSCSFIFHYKKRLSSQDLLILFEQWYQTNYRMPSNLEARLEENVLIFEYIGEEHKEKFDQVFLDYSELLKFLHYDFPIEHIVHTPILTVDTKEIKKLNKKAEQVMDLDDDPFMEAPIDHDERRSLAETALCTELEANYKLMESERRQKSIFKRGDYRPVAIGEFSERSGNVDFDGVVYTHERRETNRGRVIHTFGVGALRHGVTVKVIEDERTLTSEKMKVIAVGCHVRIRGASDLDRYSSELVVMAHFIDLLPPAPLRDDPATTKRVELHLHTKMSAMDAVGDIREYCRLAKHMGHQAIAITDHGVAQGFPEAQMAAKMHGLKMIYGVEMYMIDDDPGYVLNPSDVLLEGSTYVAFDLETTGLSISDDHIIEFGAVKIRHGMVTASLDLLINPGKGVVIPKKITEITKIDAAMLRGQPTLNEAMPRILEFMGDDILISHNAQFDIGFFNEALKRLNRPPLTNPVIDTLKLSRNFFADASSHRLGSLARKVEVVYEEGKAHRADYDAQVLAHIWMSLLIKIQAHHIKTHAAISELPRPEAMLKNFYPQHVIALVRNATGLKDLFKLVSLSHTSYWADVPRIPRKEIDKYREHLLIGSACFNGELFDIASKRTERELDEAIKFYDYIELQPKENYRWLIDMGELTPDRLDIVLHRLIHAAEKANKPIVATGDAHYVNPDDKIFRDVYVYAKGLKGVNHPLMPYNRDNQAPFENPDQHYRSTTEMLEAFAWLGEEKSYEYVVKNSNLIASQIEEVFPIKTGLFTPKIENSESYLRDICIAKAEQVYGNPLPIVVKDRLEAELNGIIKNGYSVIYYIAHMIIKKAHEDGFIVGSRGSVGSSLVATMANITEVNPLPPHYVCPKCQYSDFSDHKGIRSGFDLPHKLCPNCLTPLARDGQNIPFATFLGYEAEKVPDIDLNFPPDYQSRAHEYTRELLGEANVYRAGTIETVAEKTAFGYAKGYFERRGFDLEKVPNADIAFLAAGCQGVKKTTGQHPGGLVVIPTGYDVYDFTPVQYPADKSDGNAMTTHFDFRAVHDNILKLDLLGHVDPLALKMMADLTGVKIEDIPLNDPEALSLFSSETALKRRIKSLRALSNGALGIPEFGTSFVMGILDITKPKTFGDLVIISGLSHGTDLWRLIAEPLISEGTATLHTVIGCRDDIMTYLIEQGIPPKTAFAIMEDVRKGKKVKPEYANIMKACHVPDFYINSCNRIFYLFPKAHAVAYVTMAVRVAWFKVHYPLEYYATFFSLRSKQFDLATMMRPPQEILEKIDFVRVSTKGRGGLTPKEEETQYTLQMALEMVERGYKIANISLEHSDASLFKVDYENEAIIPPFIVVDGIGLNAANSILATREERPFLSRDDLLSRTKLSSTNLEDLARLKVLDHLDESNQLSLFSFTDY